MSKIPNMVGGNNDKKALNRHPQVLGTPAGAVKKEETLLGRVYQGFPPPPTPEPSPSQMQSHSQLQSQSQQHSPS
jgi:hypothetical protein